MSFHDDDPAGPYESDASPVAGANVHPAVRESVASPSERESLGQLVGDLSQDTSRLVRQEIALAKAELTQKAKAAGKGAAMLGAAAVIGLALLGALTAFLILLIAMWIPSWLAAAVVTVGYALLAGALAMIGRGWLSKATPAAPEQTIETVKEDVQWAKTQARSAKK